MKSDLKFLVPLSASVVILNTLAIFVIVKTRAERRKSTTLIFVSLLVSDILIGAVVIPARIVEILLLQSAVFGYIYGYVLFVAAFNVGFLAWDRYASVGRPLWRRQLGNGKVICVIAFSWLIPAFITLIPLSWRYAGNSIRTLSTSIYAYLLVAILIIILVAVVLFQVLLMQGLYGFWKGHKRNQKLSQVFQNTTSRSFRRKVISTVLVIGVAMSTIATWLPTIILNLKPEWATTWVLKWSLYSFFVNSLVDPVLVVALNFHVYWRVSRQSTSGTREIVLTRRRTASNHRKEMQLQRASSKKISLQNTVKSI